jgi:MFS family permease
MSTSRAARGWVPAAAALSAAGWGANQFTPLAVVYRSQAHWSAVGVAAMFSTYLLGLVPGLLLGGPASDRYGRRIVRWALVLSAAASGVLALAVVSQIAVYLSRLGTGLATGVVLSAGTAWVRELSAESRRPMAGSHRATYATGGGFAAGALTAGAFAQWLPDPMVLPCLPQLIVALVVLVATRHIPETARSAAALVHRPPARGQRWTTARNARFVRVVLPATPAVFAAATVAYVVLPPLVQDRVAGYAPLFSGLVTALTLTMGMAVRPVAAWLDHSGSARATIAAMATVIIGLLVGATAAYRNSAALVLAAVIFLGAGYGLTLAAGLKEIERLAPPRTVHSTVSVYHGATYTGFLTPLLLTVTAGFASYPALLAGLAAVGLLCLAFTARHSRFRLS